MTTQPEIRTESDLARFIVETRARIYAQGDAELKHASEVLETSKAMYEAAQAAFRKVRDEASRKRAAELGQLLDAAADAAQRLLSTVAVEHNSGTNEGPVDGGASVEPPGAEAGPEAPTETALANDGEDTEAAVGAASTVVTAGETAPPLAKPESAPAIQHDVAPVVSPATGHPPRQTQGGAAADQSVQDEVERVVGPQSAADPGVRPPRVGDKVLLQAGGVGEISDAMMGLARIKDGPSIKYSELVVAASGAGVQWWERRTQPARTATTTATTAAKSPAAAEPPAISPETRAPTTTATAPEETSTDRSADGKERRACERCGTKAIVLQNGQLRGHLTPDKRRCAPAEGTLAHESTKKPKGDETPAGDEWPSPKTQQDKAAGDLF